MKHYKLSEKSMAVVRKLTALLLCGAALLLAGCFESKQDYTINPDGSGRVILDVLFDPSAVSMGQQKDPQKEMEAAVRKIIKDSKGVDVWKDVTYKRMPDGRVNFKGTAYFPDLSKLDIPNYGTSFSLTREGSTVTLRMLEEKESQKGGQKKAAAAPATPPTEAEVEAEIQKAKGEWERSKPLMTAMLSGLKKEATLRLPGKMMEVNNFTKLGPNVVQVSLDGAKLIATLDAAMSDTEWMKQQAMKGDFAESGPSMDETLNQKYFGSPGPVSAKYDPGKKAQFDYKKETAAANKLYPKLLDTLGIVSRTLPGAVLKEGVTFTVGKIDDNRTSGEFFGGMKVELVMNGDVLTKAKSIRNFEVLTAVDDKGNDLRKEKEESGGGFTYQSGGGSENEGQLKQELSLKNPARAATVIRELSGHIELYIPEKDPKSKLLLKGFLKQTGKSVVSDVLKKSKVDVAVLNKQQFEAMKQKKEEADSAGTPPAGKDPVTLLLNAFSESFSSYMSVQDNGLVFLVKDPGGRVVDIEVVDASGKPLPYSSKSGGAEMRAVDFDEPLPDTAQLAIYLETPTSMVRAPFTLTDLALP